MIASKSRSRMREASALVVGAILLLWFPLFATFGAIGISIVAPPSLLLLGFVAAIGVVFALGAAATLPLEPGHGVRRTIFACAVTAIVLAAIDVSIGGYAVLNALTPDVGIDALRRPLRLAVLMALAGVVFAIVRALYRHAATLLAIVGIAAFVSTLISNPSILRGQRFTTVQHAPGPARDLPPLVYIVLDEAMGIAGLEAAPAGAPMADQVRSLFERHGFRVYPNAFSRHFVSARSIPNAINFDFTDDTYGPVLRHHEEMKVQSRLFDRLADEGYEIVTYDTEHIDFCFERSTRCEVLPSFNPFSPFITNAAQKSSAFLQIVRRAKTMSYLVYGYTVVGEHLEDQALPSAFSAVDAYAFPSWFDFFIRDVESSPRGRAYFAHILGPHSPYVVDADCRLTGQSKVPYFLSEEHGLSGAALDSTRASDYRSYYGQYGCVLSKLDDLLTRVSQTPRFRDATLIVHGDHGARISAGQYYEHLSDRDYLDNYSSLFAVKGPGIEQGIDVRRTSVQRLVAEYLSGQTPDELGPDNLTIAVDSVDAGKVILRDMATIGSSLDRPADDDAHRVDTRGNAPGTPSSQEAPGG